MSLLRTFVFVKILLTCVINNYAKDVGDSCVSRNGINGTCTLVTDCIPAFNELRLRRRHNFKRCGFKGLTEIVCCVDRTETTGIDANKIADGECEKIGAGIFRPLDVHIHGAKPASPGEFPYVVGVGFDRGSGLQFDCGGTLLSENYVLTTAHCVITSDRIPPSMVRAGVVTIGGQEWDENTDVGIAETVVHPNYTQRSKYHDLTLLRLNKSLSFSNTMHAVCLDTTTDYPTSFPLVITGWGGTNLQMAPNVNKSESHARTYSRNDILLKANVVEVNHTTCSEFYSKGNWRKLDKGVTAGQLCAGHATTLTGVGCQGDSGGPLVGSDRSGRHRLVGVLSFGRGCGNPIPDVFVRVSEYLPWIGSVIYRP